MEATFLKCNFKFFQQADGAADQRCNSIYC